MPPLAALPVRDGGSPPAISRWRTAADRARRYFFGHDVFISYARADAIEYAQGLADKLTQHHLATYVDQLGTPPGPTMPPLLLLRLRLSRMLVLLASPAAARSQAVCEEVETYLRHGHRLFVVDVDGALDGEIWYSGRIKGGPARRITHEELASGVPSERVVEQILKNVDFARREDRLRRTMRNIGVGIGVLLAIGAAGALVLQSRAAAAAAQVASLEKVGAAIGLANRARAQTPEGTNDAIVRSLLISIESLRERWTVDGAGTWLQAMSTLAPRLGQVNAHAGAVSAVAVSPDGRRLSSGGEDGMIRVWNVVEGGDTVGLVPHDTAIRVVAPVTALAFNPDGRLLAAGHGDRLSVWNADGPRIEPRLSLQLKNQAQALAFSPAGVLAVAEGDRVRLVDTETGRDTLLPVTERRAATRVAFSADGRWLAVGGGRVQIWNARSLTLAAEGPGGAGESGRPPAGGRHQLTFTSASGAVIADGVRLLLRDSAGAVRLMRADPAALSLAHGPAQTANVDGGYLVTNVYQGAAMQSLDGGNLVHLPMRLSSVRGGTAAFGPDGRWLVIGTEDGTLTFWPGTPRTESRTLPASGPVRSIAFSPTGPWLAVSDSDQTVRVLRTGTWATELRAPLDALARFTPDGRWLLAVSDSVVVPFAPGNWRALPPLAHAGFVGETWTSPNGTRLATRSGPGVRGLQGMVMMMGSQRVTVWDLSTGKSLGWRTESMSEMMPDGGSKGSDHPPVAQASDPAELAWQARTWPDAPAGLGAGMGSGGSRGEWVATNERSSVALAEAATGREVVLIHTGQREVVQVDLSHDGAWLATLGLDGTVRLWRLGGTEEMIAEACRRTPRNFTRDEWTALFPARPYRHTCPALGDPPPERAPIQPVG